MTNLSNVDPSLRRGWHAVARSADVGAEPLSVRLLGEDWALVRLSSGGTQLAAFIDRCPHRLAPLSAGHVDGDVLRCGYHGWCYAADGTCTEIPTSDVRPPRAIVRTPGGLAERNGVIFLAPEPPITELLDVPESRDPSFQHGSIEPITASAGAGLLLDNFLDMSHFPFLHAATIGTEEATVVEDVDIERRGHGMTARSRHPFPNHEDPAVATGARALVQHRRLVYEYRAPFSISLTIDYEEAGGTNVVDFFVQPVDAETCRIFTTIHRNDLDGDDARLAEAVSFEMKILDEDLRLQERYVDRRLPLDLTTEVHVKADRITVELRRILAELVKETA
jgi:phenylpropionate dioxygenase-like ring-hydroxylating dioxygenase large terminal subunit